MKSHQSNLKSTTWSSFILRRFLMATWRNRIILSLGVLLLLVVAFTGSSTSWTDSTNNHRRHKQSLRRKDRDNSILFDKTNDTIMDDRDVSRLADILKSLKRNNERPSEDEWRLFRRICTTRRRRKESAEIFEYFRQVLLPKVMTMQTEKAESFSSKSKKYPTWQEIMVTGLPKTSPSRTEASFSNQLEEVLQFGDDAVVVGPNYMLVSDGISKDKDSDFFSHQVAAYLNVGLALIDPSTDVEPQLATLVRSLEELIVEVQLPAAATLSLAFLHDVQSRRKLYVATLGDSQVRIVRGGRTLYSSPKQRQGNVPGQLNHRVPNASDDMVLEEVEIQNGDLVVMASDGLWDNVRGEEVNSLVGRSTENSANKVVTLAVQRKGERLRGNHCDEAHRNCVGGRKDDISIIVAKI